MTDDDDFDPVLERRRRKRAGSLPPQFRWGLIGVVVCGGIGVLFSQFAPVFGGFVEHYLVGPFDPLRLRLIPIHLFVFGGVGLVLGVGAYFAGGSQIDMSGLAPARAVAGRSGTAPDNDDDIVLMRRRRRKRAAERRLRYLMLGAIVVAVIGVAAIGVWRWRELQKGGDAEPEKIARENRVVQKAALPPVVTPSADGELPANPANPVVGQRIRVAGRLDLESVQFDDLFDMAEGKGDGGGKPVVVLDCPNGASAHCVFARTHNGAVPELARTPRRAVVHISGRVTTVRPGLIILDDCRIEFAGL